MTAPITPPVLHYESVGQGPVVVLLHGFLASSAYWRDIPRQLSEHYRVISIDLLGFGQSSKPRHSRYDYQAHLQSIQATLDDAGVTRPFQLAGHSMGALLALRYGRLYPERISRLVLANLPIMTHARQVRREILRTNLAYRLGLTPGTDQLAWAVFRLLARHHWLPGRSSGYVTTHLQYIFQNTSRSRRRSFTNIIARGQVAADLRQVLVPTWLLSGARDRPLYGRNARRLVLSRTVTTISVPTGHNVPLDRPDVLLGVLRSTRPPVA